jgi:hypothetical protein
MKKIIEYDLVTGEEPELINAVNRLIAQGWQPLGGIALTSYTEDDGTLWSQAMVRHEG